MPTTRTNRKSIDDKNSDEPKIAKATQPTDDERKAGILARRKVRATGHVIERIDGKAHELGDEGGRWIIRVVSTGKITRHASYAEMVKAGRNA